MRDFFASPGPLGRPLPDFIDPDKWMAHLFSSKSACQVGVVRRKLRDVERIVGLNPFRAELKRRGYRAVINGGQIVVFCNREPVHLVE